MFLIAMIYFSSQKNIWATSETNNYKPARMTYRSIADDMRIAIKDDKVVVIIYDKPNWDSHLRKYIKHTKSTWKIKPIVVYSENQVLYLKEYYYLRNKGRLFRISRIISYDILYSEKNMLSIPRYSWSTV